MNPYVRVARLAALKQTSAVVESLRELDGDPHEVFARLRTHGLIGLFVAIVPPHELREAVPSRLAEEFDAWRMRPRASHETLLRGFASARAALEAEGIPALLLKGSYFGERLYGGVAYRPQFDVDVLVPERDFRAAVRALVRRGFARQAYDLHSRTLTIDGWKLDVHRCLRRAPAFRIDEGQLWESAIEARAGGVDFRTLSDEWTLVLLILGTFEDLGQGMTKVRQLLDLYLLLRAIDAQVAWNDFFAGREREHLTAVAVNVLSLVAELFEASTELPHLEAALKARRALLDGATRADAAGLVFAPRKHPANLAWFGRIYPGSLPRYLAWFWYGGFPANLNDLAPSRLVATMRVAVGTRPGDDRRA